MNKLNYVCDMLQKHWIIETEIRNWTKYGDKIKTPMILMSDEIVAFMCVSSEADRINRFVMTK